MVTILYCTECEREITIYHTADISKGQSLRCAGCNTQFNVFAIYKSFYEDIPLAKKLADIKIVVAKKDYRVIGKEEDVRIIIEFFENSKFDMLYAQIISDLVIYGNAFVEKNNEHKTVERHDPATSLINVKKVLQGTLQEEVVHLTTKEGRNITSSNLIHFAVKNYMEPPFGESSYGFWFELWYLLKLSPNALINASIFTNMGYVWKTPEEITQRRKELEKRVIQGAGLDPGLIDPDLKPSPYAIRELQEDAGDIQREVVTKVESEILPFVLNRDLDTNYNNLRFEIEGFEE
jgi:hypothetical protein